MYFPVFSLASIFALALSTIAVPFTTGESLPSCDYANDFEYVCAEIYNGTDCTGPVSLVTGAGCHNVPAESSGSIRVSRGEVFAGFPYKDCRYNPEVFAGPMWKGEDQGCQDFGTKRMVRSWHAF